MGGTLFSFENIYKVKVKSIWLRSDPVGLGPIDGGCDGCWYDVWLQLKPPEPFHYFPIDYNYANDLPEPHSLANKLPITNY